MKIKWQLMLLLSFFFLIGAWEMVNGIYETGIWTGVLRTVATVGTSIFWILRPATKN